MNRKERMAAAILVGTLAGGVLVDVFDGGPAEKGGDRHPAEGCVVVVGGDSAEVAEDGDVEAAGADSTGGAAGDGGASNGSPEGAGYKRIDINSAGIDQLMLLPGIGPKKAEAVVEWRAKRGRFHAVDDLLEVRGIGKSTLERLRPYARVGD